MTVKFFKTMPCVCFFSLIKVVYIEQKRLADVLFNNLSQASFYGGQGKRKNAFIKLKFYNMY